MIDLQSATPQDLLREEVRLLYEINERLEQLQAQRDMVVSDVNMSFNNMVGFIFKWALASLFVLIPLSLVCGFLYAGLEILLSLYGPP